MTDTHSDTGPKTVKRVTLGLALFCAGVAALWQNELRFDVVSAATATAPTSRIERAVPGSNVSVTGRFEPTPEIKDRFVGRVTGYMAVRRVAEIYAWDRDKRTGKPDRWTLEWQRRPDSNERNSPLTQRFKSRTLKPKVYRIAGLDISSKNTQFVDPFQPISTNRLRWQDSATRPTTTQSGYFYFSANGKPVTDPQFGDERVSYTAIPLPSTATYFGQFDGERAVADESERKAGFVNKVIRNTGLLHHVVAGDRAHALESIAAHQSRLKMTVRLVGTLVTVIGLYVLLKAVFGALFLIPVIGEWIAGSVTAAALCLGLVVSAATITLAYLAANPISLLALCAAIGAVFFTLAKRARTQSAEAQKTLTANRPTATSQGDQAELEFIELAHLATVDGTLSDKEHTMLLAWGHKQGWSKSHCESLLKTAAACDSSQLPGTSTPLLIASLVRLALADGNLSPRELKRINAIAIRAGIDTQLVKALVRQHTPTLPPAAT